jgi:hypothetical protein
MAAVQPIGYSGFSTALSTLLGGTSTSEPAEDYVNEHVAIFQGFAAIEYNLVIKETGTAQQKVVRSKLEMIQSFIHVCEGLADIPDGAAPGPLSPAMLQRYEGARSKALAKLKDCKLALLFVLEEPSEEADAAFQFEYPESQARQSSVPLDLD